MLPIRAFFASLACSVAALAGCSGDSLPSGSSGDPTTSSSGATSSSSGTATSGTAGSTSSAGSSGASGASGGDPIAACISSCEAQHPKGAQIGKGIDQCWSNSCPTQCNGIGAGKQKPPAHGSCKNPVTTPSADCSQCTVDKCCKAWNACFDDADCSALNACSIACYK